MRAIAATAAALTLALTASASTEAAHVASIPAFVFGRSGGNIMPFSVRISRAGHLTASGPVKLARPGATVPAAALRGLLSLAKAEGFYALPPTVVCRGALPDLASSFVAVTGAHGTTQVSVRGACKVRFAQLYAVLNTVAGVE